MHVSGKSLAKLQMKLYYQEYPSIRFNWGNGKRIKESIMIYGPFDSMNILADPSGLFGPLDWGTLPAHLFRWIPMTHQT
jgi:hypothetical protein